MKGWLEVANTCDCETPAECALFAAPGETYDAARALRIVHVGRTAAASPIPRRLLRLLTGPAHLPAARRSGSRRRRGPWGRSRRGAPRDRAAPAGRRDAAVQRADGRLVLPHGAAVRAVAQHVAEPVRAPALEARREAERGQRVLHRVAGSAARRAGRAARGRPRGRPARSPPGRAAARARARASREPAVRLSGPGRPAAPPARSPTRGAAGRAPGPRSGARAARPRRAARAAARTEFGCRPTRSASSCVVAGRSSSPRIVTSWRRTGWASTSPGAVVGMSTGRRGSLRRLFPND